MINYKSTVPYIVYQKGMIYQEKDILLIGFQYSRWSDYIYLVQDYNLGKRTAVEIGREKHDSL